VSHGSADHKPLISRVMAVKGPLTGLSFFRFRYTTRATLDAMLIRMR